MENAVVGPFVAVISFVCSVGNVPLASALWQGGITFGGVVAFVFADLIALPVVLIYRRQYGGRMALRLLALFWTVMTAAGLATEYLFKALVWIPAAKAAQVVGDTVRWNYTTVLNIVALVAFAALYWVYRKRERFGAGAGCAKDPVCGMQVETAHAPASVVHDRRRIYFCSDHCQLRFEANPHRYATSGAAPEGDGGPDEERPHGTGPDIDRLEPVCGMTVDPGQAAAQLGHRGKTGNFAAVWSCSTGCAQQWDAAQPAGRRRAAPGYQ